MAQVGARAPKPVAKPVRVRVDGAVQTAYLLKVPEHIYQRCCDAAAGEHIADVDVAGAAPVRLHVAAYTRKAAAEGRAEEVEEPSTCEIRAQPAQCDATYALAEAPGSAIALVGRVSASGTAVRDAKRELLHKRAVAAPKRSVLAFEGDDERPTLKRATTSAAPTRELRDKLAPDELKRKLLSLFTLERPYWSMAELTAETKQPREHLSEALQQVCTLNTSGENRSKYELIAKYRA